MLKASKGQRAIKMITIKTDNELANPASTFIALRPFSFIHRANQDILRLCMPTGMITGMITGSCSQYEQPLS